MSNQRTAKKRNAFYDWCEKTSSHGWVDWLHAETYFSRVTWSIFLFICTVAMCYSLFSLIRTFITSDKWTTTVYEAHDERAALPFPSVTICNINRLKHSVAEEYNFTQPLRAYFFSKFPILYPITNSFTTQMATPDEYGAWRKQHNMTFARIMELMGNNCTQIPQIRIGTTTVHNICSAESQKKLMQLGAHFQEVISPEYGKCLQLNFDPSVYNVSSIGSQTGISFILNVELEEYLPDLDMNFLDEGIAIQTDYNQRFHVGSWMMAKPGTHTFIGLQQQLTQLRSDLFYLFPPPCAQTPRMTILHEMQYSRRNCEADCVFEYVYKTCGCLNLIKTGQHPICEFDEIDACMGSSHSLITIMNTPAIANCTKQCKPACVFSKVHTTLSTTKFPGDKQLDNLKQFLSLKYQEQNLSFTLTKEQIATSFAAVDIYFKALEVSVVERYELYTIEVLLSQIGGSLGLWAGISICTMAQTMGFILYRFGASKFCTKKRVEVQT